MILANKYHRLRDELETKGFGKMKCFGYSMVPILQNGTVNTYIKQETYEIGDIVFCKVKGTFIDAHKITKKDANKGYMISNNHGHDNGWTKTIYGRVIKAEYRNIVKEL